MILLVTECSAVGSALRSGRRGRAFESPHSDAYKNTTANNGSPLYFYIITMFVVGAFFNNTRSPRAT